MDTWATADFGERPTPNVFLQWKGTDVCLDFRCACGADGHFDGYSAYQLRCPGCARLWRMPHTVGLLPGAEDDADTQTPMEDLDDAG